MTEQWSLPAWAVLAVTVAALLVMLTLAVLAARAVRRVAAQRAESDARLAEVQARVEELARTLAAAQEATPAPDDQEYVITRLGTEPAAGEPSAPARIDGPLFADLVLRESVVQAASLAHGLRRALAAETRHRIRFEMRRELKRARKQRRAEIKEARRAWAARERAEMAS